MARIGNKIVVDTYAWIEYFRGTIEGERAKKFIDGDFQLLTPSIVIAELSDKSTRGEMSDWDIKRRFISLKSGILPLDETTADKAGKIKHWLRKKYKDVGIIDAIILTHSLIAEARLLTGDTHLKSLENAIDISS